jgi:hypothetical protein
MSVNQQDYAAPAQDGKAPTGPMTESELKATLWAKINNSISYQGGRLNEYRMQALRYYNGDKFGNEVQGRSQVVSRDVAEAIDSIMPSLMRIFTTSDEAVRFDGRTPTDDQIAPQISDYCNWVWNTQNPGFENFFVWFKAALMDRLGVLKIWWDEQEQVTKETYTGLTAEQLSRLVMAGDVEVNVITSYSDPDAGKAEEGLEILSELARGETQADGDKVNPAFSKIIDALTDVEPAMVYDVEATFRNKEGRIRVAVVPGDEFLIERRAVSMDWPEPPFCAHRHKTTISDLLKLYPDQADKIWALPTGEEAEYTMERIERFKQEDQLPWRQDNPADPSMREVWLVDAYLRVDYDGDGYGEMRKVTVAGDLGYTILENIEVDDHPFCTLCPIPMPFKLIGMSIADQTMDLQLIKSTVLRGILDNMYNAILPQLAVVDGKVNLDDLLTRRPGGVVRMQMAGAVEPLPNPMLGQEPYGLIDYLDNVREQRTGVTRYNQGLDADSLNKTARGVQMIKNAGAERVELIARIFAETGVRRAFKRILELTCKHNRKKQTIKLRGKWVDVDPREWSTQFDVTVNVGLGTGDREQQQAIMMQLLGLDQQIIMAQQGMNGPLVRAENIYNKLAKILEYAGYKSVDPFYTDPASLPPQQPGQPHPDPHMMAQQASDQAAMQRDQMKIQADNQRTQMELAHKREIAMAEIALKRELGLMEINLNAAKLGIERQAVDQDHHLASVKAYHDAASTNEDQAIRRAEVASAHINKQQQFAQNPQPQQPGV